MGQQHHVQMLAFAGRPALPGEITTLADTKDVAKPLYGEFFFRLIDKGEPHRLPSRAKKAVARFRMSRSWRNTSFSFRSRFNSATTSGGADPPGTSAAR